MAKKMLILNGSPRAAGNTALLADAFAEGAREAGHAVTAFRLSDMHIHGCLGCFGGGADKNSPCVQKDDMDKIYPAYREADVVVLASPLYFWTLSGQLRTAMDRLFAAHEGAHGDRSPKQAVLLMAAGGDGFDDVSRYYDTLTTRLGWTSLGKVLAGGINKPGAVADGPKPAEARALGASIG